jgi:hypothetical protein
VKVLEHLVTAFRVLVSISEEVLEEIHQGNRLQVYDDFDKVEPDLSMILSRPHPFQHRIVSHRDSVR